MEHLSIQCPHCSKEVTFDDNGDPIPTTDVTLKDNQHIGLGGLVSTEVGTSKWRETQYKYNQQSRYQPPKERVGNLPDLNQPEEVDTPTNQIFPDDEIEQVVVEDLRKRNINNKTY